MAKIILLHYLLFILLSSSLTLLQGSRIQAIIPHSQRAHQGALHYEGGAKRWVKKNSRRLMIGSVAPTCTYNECRGCKYKCRAEQVPVEGNDPMNSPYHYKCVCHR
ncbi:EPIDERMAL PATTERNING FACTOR-like protein 9 [Capsicum chacoense]